SSRSSSSQSSGAAADTTETHAVAARAATADAEASASTHFSKGTNLIGSRSSRDDPLSRLSSMQKIPHCSFLGDCGMVATQIWLAPSEGRDLFAFVSYYLPN